MSWETLSLSRTHSWLSPLIGAGAADEVGVDAGLLQIQQNLSIILDWATKRFQPLVTGAR